MRVLCGKHGLDVASAKISIQWILFPSTLQMSFQWKTFKIQPTLTSRDNMESVSNRFAGITKFNPHRNMYTSRHSKTQKIALKTSKSQET